MPLRSVRTGGKGLFTVFSSFGPTELIIVLVIVLLIFGPKRLPGLGKQLGTGMREFKDSITGGKDDDEEQRERVTAALGRPEGEATPSVDDVTTAPAEPEARERTSQT
jgi:sec-independent protein translocase protein TatA